MSVEKPLPSSILTSSEGLNLPPGDFSRDYIALDTRFLYPDQVTDFPIYTYHSERGRFVLFKGKGDPIRADQLESLSHGGQKPVFISTVNAGQFTRFLSESLSQIVEDESLPLEEKTNRFTTLASSVMQSLFESPPNMQEFVATARNISDTLANLISSEPASIAQLNGLRSYDYYTYSHCLNVCVLGIGLYRQIESDTPQIKIQDLARGLLLHDIGKCDIPHNLTNKTGALSDDEWKVMRSHTIKGYERLESDIALSPESHQVALSHHEAVDGSGYPNGLTKDFIPLTSRICKVADVYDALTSNRSYKSRLSPFDSLQLMTDKMKNQLDQDILKEFIHFLDKMGKIQMCQFSG